VTPKRLYTFAIDPDLDDALKRYKADHGVGESEQIRRALRTWFEKRGVIKKAQGKRAVTRKPR